ncbi:MAG: TlpA disulfide reductase family protein [Methylococcaceae bacterium]|nr:TlpA disulfide reductase family protein [Methylococcaceae bacterium]
MKPVKTLIALVLAALTGASIAAESPAPHCRVTDLQSGQALDLPIPQGKVVYLDFWASWCGPCVMSFPFMNQLHAELKAQGLEVVAVDLDEVREDALAFLKKTPAQFTVVQDPEGKCPGLYDVKAMPNSYLIDRRGNIRHVHLGFRDGDKPALRQKVQELLAEKP